MRGRVFLLLVFSVLFITTPLQTYGDFGFAGGSGTINDPYLVETSRHLDNIRNHRDAHFKQIADIDLSDYSDGEGWRAIGIFFSDPFSGVYDGNGYKITNLTINRPDTDTASLFGYLSGDGAMIDNVTLEDVSVTGRYFVGALTGSNSGGTIINCSVSGSVTGIDRVGGLVGWNSSHAVISGCSSSASVTGQRSVGGLVGVNRSHATVTRSSANSDVSGYINIGGLAGYNFKDGEITRSFARGNVTGNKESGGLVGKNNSIISDSYSLSTVTANAEEAGGLVGSNDEHGIIKNSYTAGKIRAACYCADNLIARDDSWDGIHGSYYDASAATPCSPFKGDPKTTEELKLQETFENWDFDETWGIIEGISFPYLLWEKPIAGFTADITEGSVPLEVSFTDLSRGDIDERYWDFGNDYTSSDKNPSTTFAEPGRYTITLKVEGTDGSGVTARDHYIRAKGFAGGTGTQEDPYLIATAGHLYSAGFYKDAWFEQTDDIDLSEFSDLKGWEPIGSPEEPFQGHYNGNRHQISNLVIDRPEDDNVGLFGYISENAILSGIRLENVQIKGNNNVGGLAGFSHGSVSSSSVTGSVSGNVDVGGLIGRNDEGSIEECYALAEVCGYEDAGGLVGYNSWNAVISHSYAVSAVSAHRYAGGLVGSNGGTLSESFSAGDVAGDRYIGGLTGNIWGSSKIVNSYYKHSAPDELISQDMDCPVTDVGIPKTVDDLKKRNTFENWDFDKTWTIVEGQTFPHFQWQRANHGLITAIGS